MAFVSVDMYPPVDVDEDLFVFAPIAPESLLWLNAAELKLLAGR